MCDALDGEFGGLRNFIKIFKDQETLEYEKNCLNNILS